MEGAQRLRLPLRALGKAVRECGVEASTYGQCVSRQKAIAPQACAEDFAKVGACIPDTGQHMHTLPNAKPAAIATITTLTLASRFFNH